MRRKAVLLVLGLGVAEPALAHRPSDAFLTLDIEGTTLSGELDVALKDLEVLFGVDQNGDGQISWGEVQAQEQAFTTYVQDRLKLQTDSGPCALLPLDLQISKYSDGAYAALIFNTTCTDRPIKTLDADYSLLFDLDRQHRGLLRLTYREQIITTAFADAARTFHFDAMAGGVARQMQTFVKEGLHHIFAGFDHMLFLIALILPAVYFRRRSRELHPREHLREVLWDTAKVVTAFTAAHTLSLCLTTFQVIIPPAARVVEAAVALTILLASLNNLAGVVKEHRWVVGFGFGLIHGVGYASVLRDLGLSGWSLATPLVGFNVGVELAQLAIIAAFLPVAFLLRRTKFYKGIFLWGGSMATGALALGWMVEQIGNVKFLPF